jgi:hypothetical protein
VIISCRVSNSLTDVRTFYHWSPEIPDAKPITPKKKTMKRSLTLLVILITALISKEGRAQWTAVGTGMDNYVWGSVVYNGELYACGNFEHADGNPSLAIARWNGSAWSDVGGGFQHGAFSNVVRGLIVFNGELFAGGFVDSVGGMLIHKIAKWNGSSWSPAAMDCPISTVNCFCIHNGELYAGGQGSGLVKVCVARWTGSSWVGLDVEGGNTDVWSMVSYNGYLYAGGGFSDFNGQGIGGVARWDGTSWSDIGSGFTAFNSIKALAVFDNRLYIAGGFTEAGGVPANYIVAWDGTNWTPLNGGANAAVTALLAHGDKLFVAGNFWEIDGITANRAAYWDGSSWTVLGTDLGAGNMTIAIYDDELYYGGAGAFNGQNFIAKWAGGTFTGIKNYTTSAMVNIYPNPAIDKIQVVVSEPGLPGNSC